MGSYQLAAGDCQSRICKLCTWHCACREIRMGEYGEIIAKFDKCGPHSHFTIKDLIQDFCAEIISKGDFEKIWDK